MASIKVGAGVQLCPSCLGQRQAEAIVPFLNPPPTKTQSQKEGAISETPSTWLTLFALPWRSQEALSHPNYRSTQAVNSGFSL